VTIDPPAPVVPKASPQKKKETTKEIQQSTLSNKFGASLTDKDSNLKKDDPRATNTEAIAPKPVGPKEVEQNPFKKLIDITDLMDFEANPTEVEKECQNILLRHNSELKQWY
jgi:hypothetical protein